MLGQRGSLAIILSFFVLVLLFVGGGLFFLKRDAFFPAPKPSTAPIILDAIKDHITYTKPESWIEQNAGANNTIVLKSSDLLVTINRVSTDAKKALDIALHPQGEQASYSEDIVQTTVSGLPAVSYHNNYEQHDKSYVVGQQSNLVWQIAISSKDQSIENKHTAEIDGFIRSISIK